MLHLIPPTLPSLEQLMPDLGNPSAAQLGRALDVSPRTLFRWRASGAPRVALLALYWLTPWSWSAHECEARARLADWRGLAEALQRENEALHGRLAHLCALNDHGAANSPLRAYDGPNLNDAKRPRAVG